MKKMTSVISLEKVDSAELDRVIWLVSDGKDEILTFNGYDYGDDPAILAQEFYDCCGKHPQFLVRVELPEVTATTRTESAFVDLKIEGKDLLPDADIS